MLLALIRRQALIMQKQQDRIDALELCLSKEAIDRFAEEESDDET